MKQHRVGEKKKSGRHGLFLGCWLPAWQVSRELGAGFILKSLTLRAEGWRVETSQQSLKITEDQGTLFSKRFRKNCRIKQEL